MESSLSRQVKNLCNIEVSNSIDLLNSLDTIADEYPLQNDIKSIIKNRSTHYYKSVIHQLKPIQNSLQNLHTQQQSLISKLKLLNGQVNDSLSCTSLALKSNTRLTAELDYTSKKRQSLQHFLQQLKLKQQEELLITSSEHLNQNFFQVLKKLQKISDSSLLLDTTQSRLLKISVDDYIAYYFEKAYQKLFRFVQEQCRILQQQKIQILPGFYQAIQSLKKRKIYYTHCRDQLIVSRQRYFTRSFRKALKQGEDPLESHLADPVHFVGWTLAWVQSSTLSEKELIEGLLGQVEQLDLEGDNMQQTTIIDKITNSIEKELKDVLVRAINNSSMLECFKVLILLAFHIKELTDKNLLSFASLIVKNLYKCSNQAEERLYLTTKQQIETIKVFSISTDLAVPRVFSEKFQQFMSILKLMFQNTEFQVFYTHLYEQFVQVLYKFYKEEAMAALQSDRQQVLLINFLIFVRNGIELYEFTSDSQELISEELEKLNQSLVEVVTKKIVEEFNLFTLQLPRNLQAFYENLLSTGQLDIPVLQFLYQDQYRHRIRVRINQEICRVYEELAGQTREIIPRVDTIRGLLK